MSKFICQQVTILEREPVLEYPHISDAAKRAGKVIQTGEKIKLEITLVSSGYTKDITLDQIAGDILNKLESVANEPRTAQ